MKGQNTIYMAAAVVLAVSVVVIVSLTVQGQFSDSAQILDRLMTFGE